MSVSVSLPAHAVSSARPVDTEATLLDRCQRGDARAQREFYESHYRMVLGIALRYAVDEPQARDWLNQTFLTAFKRLGQFRREGPVAAWLRTISVNVCLAQLRIRRNQSYAELPTRESGRHVAPPQALQSLAVEDLVALIQQLPPVPRAVFNLTAVEGFSHREAATRLGITETTSRYHLRQARIRLQAAVTKLEKS